MLRKNRNFQRTIYHRVFINLGDSIFYIVLMWMLYDLTKKSLYTSIGGFMFSLSDVLNFFIGPMIDRFNKRRLLTMSSGIQFFIVTGLYFLSVNGGLSVSVLVFSIPFFNLMSRMTYSIHNVIIPSIVEKNELVRANSILSMTSTGIDLLFNAISGVLLVLLSLQNIFFINSTINLIAFLIAVIAFRNFSSKSSQSEINAEGKTLSLKEVLQYYREDLKNGLLFVRNRTILSLIIPLVGLNLLYAMMVVNLPEFSSEIYGSAIGYGFTLTLFAAGSISGTALSSRFMKHFSVGKSLPVLFLYGGTSWVLMAFVVEKITFVGGLFIITASSALGMINIVFGTIFQQLPPRQMIGRVNTVNLSLMAVASLVGSLLGGVIGQLSNSVLPFSICGLGYLMIAVAMRVNKHIYGLPKVSDMNERTLSN